MVHVNIGIEYFLQDVIPPDQQTVIFTATRHHVEYLQVLLELANVSATYIYSNLDPAARKINAAKFATKKLSVMVVTDIAARGIDIPMLSNVINYHFPAKSKLFIHRAGRVARAGRTGTAYSLVGVDEMAYFIDLQLFLGGSPQVVPPNPSAIFDWHRCLGKIPLNVCEDYAEQLATWSHTNQDLDKSKQTAANGYKQYLKSRPGASVESVKRTKEMRSLPIGDHPVLSSKLTSKDNQRYNILDEMKKFRPKATIFEIGNTTKNKETIEIMNTKRKKHEAVIENASKRQKLEEISNTKTIVASQLQDCDEDDIVNTFETVVSSSKPSQHDRKKKKVWKKDENYIAYESSDRHTEAGFSLNTGFAAQVGT